jgi:hypothetical protein
MVTGEMDDEHGDPLEMGFGLLWCAGAPEFEVGVVGDRRWSELESLISVLSSSFSLSLFSSELLRVSAASMDFLCIPGRFKKPLAHSQT